MLWTAPELLRLSEKEQTLNGTRTGDIYALGLIIQEIVFRCLPFQAEDHDPEGARSFASFLSNIYLFWYVIAISR